MAYELFSHWLPLLLVGYGALVFLYLPWFWLSLATAGPRSARAAATGLFIGAAAVMGAYCVFGSHGLWADRYAIADLTPLHERLALGALWEVIRLGLAFAVCLRIISGKFQRQWRALLHEPGSRWSRRSSIALAGAVIFAATAYHIDAGLAPFELVKNRAANLLDPSSRDGVNTERQERSRRRYPFDSRPETLQGFAAASGLSEMTDALAYAEPHQRSADELAEEEAFLNLMQPAGAGQEPGPAARPSAKVDEARRREEFWYAFVRSAVLPYAAYLAYSLVALGAVVVPLICIAVYGAALDLHSLRRRFTALSNAIHGTSGATEAEALFTRFSTRLSHTAGKHCELPLWIAALLATELLVGQDSLPTKHTLVVAAALAGFVLLAVLAAAATLQNAARRRLSGRLAVEGQAPRFLQRSLRIPFLRRLSEQKVLVLAATAAGVAWVAAGAKIILLG